MTPWMRALTPSLPSTQTPITKTQSGDPSVPVTCPSTDVSLSKGIEGGDGRVRDTVGHEGPEGGMRGQVGFRVYMGAPAEWSPYPSGRA